MAQHAFNTPTDDNCGFEPFGAARRDGERIAKPSVFLRKNFPDLHKWLTELFPDEAIDAHITARDRTEDGRAEMSLSLWTSENEFIISVRAPTGKMIKRFVRHNGKSRSRSVRDTGYLGAGLVARAPYVGEQHRRGSDLHDGDYSEKTWRGIMNDVLRISFLEIHEWARRWEKRWGSRKRRTKARSKKGRR